MTPEILTSGIWQTTTTILVGGEGCVVVDPAYFPRELEVIAARAAAAGGAGAVVFTHGHWDHVMGHAALPGAPVWASAELARAVAAGEPRTRRDLDGARDFDSRWYVPRPAGWAWPADLRGLADGQRIELAGIAVRALAVAGHSPDGLAVVVEDCGLLLAGDHLSPCEIPFVDDLDGYRATLERLLELLAGEVREVVPGHGHRLSAAEAAAIARDDLVYLDRLAEAGARRDLDGARAMPLPRAGDVVGMRDHHRDNCRRVGLAL